MNVLRRAAVVLLVATTPAIAHHSYSMFDASTKTTVSGTVAKLEWANPHVYVWVYVPSRDKPGKYDLYAFENGSVGVLARVGWSKDVLKAGESVSVEFYPLRDGRPGGHLIMLKCADGRRLRGVGGPLERTGPKGAEFEIAPTAGDKP